MEPIGNIKKFFGLKRNAADPAQLRKGVREAYSEAAANPGGKHPFPVGREFAESIGYPKDLLDSFPDFVSDTFTGVSNVSVFAEIPSGSTVLDIGCGAGLDSLIASEKTGKDGKVIGVDFSHAMLEKAKKGCRRSNRLNIELHCAAAESLPLPDRSVDVILVNGIFNLNPSRKDVFQELARVIQPGGSLYAAELILKEPQPSKTACSLDDWFS